MPRTPSAVPALLLSLAGFLPFSARAATVFVDRNASGTMHDGVSWATAYATIQTGVDAAARGDEVWVAAATYTEAVTLKDGVALYGGFAGTETARDERDPKTHETVLDGQLSRTNVTVPAGAGPETVLDGFVLTRGSSNTTNPGGVLITDASPTIRGNVFRGNGGTTSGLLITGASAAPLIEGNTLTGSLFSKACIQVQSGANPTIRGNVLTENTAGGIAVNGAAGLIDGNTLDHNVLRNEWGANQTGCGITLLNATTVVRGNTVTRFVGGSSGGGLYVKGGAPAIAGNRIASNYSSSGGGLMLDATNALVSGNVIAYNSANTGAGLNVNLGNPVVTGNVIFANRGSSMDWRTPSSGAGLLCRAGTGQVPVIRNNTLVANANGGALDIYGGTHPLVVNNIVAWNAAPGSVRTISGTVHHNCLWNNPEGSDNGAPGPDPSGTIHQDPRFASLLDGDFHIQPDSPCRDTGDGTAVQPDETDMDGQPRLQGARVDIGADESDGTTWDIPRRVLHVRPDGDDANDGLSWSMAKKTIQAAVAAARDAFGGEVWVAGGAYSGNVALDTLTRLYGGFSGSEGARDERDPAAHPTELVSTDTNPVLAVDNGTLLVSADGFRFGAQSTGAWCGYASQARISGNTFEGAAKVVGTNQQAQVTVSDNLVRDCLDGIHIGQYASAAIERNRITGCPTGIIVGGGTATIANNLLAGNTDSGVSVTLGGSATLVNDTIAGAAAGSGVDVESGSASLTNTILAFSATGITAAAGTTVTFSNDCVFGNTTPASGVSFPSGTNGNIVADPQFADRASGDYHLATGSPCIDAGTASGIAASATDLDGNPRIAGNAPDIGAYETSAPVPVTMEDVALALRYAAGLSAATEPDRSRLEADATAGIGMGDAVLLGRKAAGLAP